MNLQPTDTNDSLENASSQIPGAASPGTLTDRNQLLAILSRAVTLANGYQAPCLDDDLRLLGRLGARFLGRAAYVWQTKADDAGHFAKVTEFCRRVHSEVSRDVVVQAAIFEAIYPEANTIPIPAWVFEDLNEPVETRCFRYECIRGAVVTPGQGMGGLPWQGGAVPDLSSPEAIRWFYYRARRYLESGCEAIHLGQSHLVAACDPGYRRLRALVSAIRTAAARHARRGWVILDAHSHGIAHEGRLLFDFCSRPLSARPLLASPERIALIRRGPALGGIHPGGWSCTESPILIEVDNWGGYSHDPDPKRWLDTVSRAQAGRWGWDDISWFAHQPRQERHDFLRYAHRWARLQGPYWFFQMPVTRSLGLANIILPAGQSLHRYRANSPSPACPDGFGDEDAIASVWQESDTGSCVETADPSPPMTGEGLNIPAPVAVVGQLQPLLGGIPGDASCPWSTLFHIGNGRFQRTFAIPHAGNFAFTITAGGTGTDPTNSGGQAGGAPWRVHIARPGDLLRIGFCYGTRQVTAIDPVTGADLLVH